MKGDDNLYPNVEAEMARLKITRNKLSVSLNLSPNTLGKKLNGESNISLPECLKIKKELKWRGTIEELFKTD